jgi:multiple sugar transport system ATP-binding protein
MGISVGISKLAKSFGTQHVLEGIDLQVEQGELISLLGPSGCGKSTLLRIIAGLEKQTSGSVDLNGQNVDGLEAGQRDLAMVFQSYALYPHMTVGQNIRTPLEMTELNPLQRLPLVGGFMPGSRRLRDEINRQVIAAAKTTEIAHLLDRRPNQLSGGQRQRVALSRALVREPGLFLMDEPLSNLDAKLRVVMREEIVSLNRRLGATFIFVTHDQADALAMSDRVALMMNGKLLQVAHPQEIYDAPTHVDVATFIGHPNINLFESQCLGGAVNIKGGASMLNIPELASGKCTVGIRPESLEPAKNSSSESCVASFPVRLRRVEQMGAEVLLRCEIASTHDTVVSRLTVGRYNELRSTGILAGDFALLARGRGIQVFDEAGYSVLKQEKRQKLAAAS